MIHSFPKSKRLLTRLDYKRMKGAAKRYVGSFMTIDVRSNGLDVTRLGLTITRRFGDAHRRNRFKRIAREAFRLSYDHLQKGIDINIRPFHKQFDLTMQDIQTDLIRFLNHA